MKKQKIKTVNDIVVEVFDNFIPGFWSRTGTNKEIIRGFSGEISELSRMISKVYDQISIETARNDSLDDFGLLFKLARGLDESDDVYRSRLKSYYQTFLNSGTLDGIKESILLLTKLKPENIIIEPVMKYTPQQFIANMEEYEDWKSDQTDTLRDYNYYYEGKCSIRLEGDNVSVETILDRDLNLDLNVLDCNDAFRIWYHWDDLNLIDNIKLKFVDSDEVTAHRIILPEHLTDNNSFLMMYKNEFNNCDIIDWSNIKTINIMVKFTGPTFITLDWLQLGTYDESLKFGVSFEIDEHFDESLLNTIDRSIEMSKAAGTYYNKHKSFTSKDNLFLVNFSDYNGENTFL